MRRARGRGSNQKNRQKGQREIKKVGTKDRYYFGTESQFSTFHNDPFFQQARIFFPRTFHIESQNHGFRQNRNNHNQNHKNKNKNHKSVWFQSHQEKQHTFMNHPRFPSIFQIKTNNQIDNFKKKRMGKRYSEEENFFKFKFNAMFGIKQQRNQSLQLKITLMQILVESSSLIDQNQYSQIMLPSAYFLRLFIQMRLNELLQQASQYKVLNILLITNDDIKEGFQKINSQYQAQEDYINQYRANYCMNFYRSKQVQLLKSNLKDIVNKNNSAEYESEQTSFQISFLNRVIFNIIGPDTIYGDNNLDTVTFGRSYLRLFQQYNQRFFQKKSKENYNEHIIYDCILIGAAFNKNKINCLGKKQIEFHPTYQNAKADIQFINKAKFIMIDISLAQQVIARISISKQSIISIHVYSDPYKTGKKFLFRFKTPPSFQAQFNPKNISLKNGKYSSFWHIINNFSIQYRDYFADKDIAKIKFTKNFCILIQSQRMGKRYVQLFDEYGLGPKMHHEQIAVLKRSLQQFEADELMIYSFAQKCCTIIKNNLEFHQKSQQYLLKLHYIQLDYLLAVQYGTYPEVNRIFQLIKSKCSFQQIQKTIEVLTQLTQEILNIIDEFYQEIHTNKLYQKQHRSFKKSKKQSSKPKRQKIFPIYNVAFTPTGIRLRGYTNQLQSRVFRQFNHSLFIKVTFCRDDGNLIVPETEYNDSTYLIQHVFRQNIAGFKLGGVQYLPLGWSNSQIKKQQMWFVNCDNSFYTNLRQDIYRFLGNFSSISNPAKRAARIGQNFANSFVYSQSLSIIDQIIEDIYTPIINRDEIYIGYAFSDGIGQLSDNILLRIIQQYRLPQEVCAIQCRFLGCKGVFSLGKHSNIPNKLFIRESMKKFECQDVRARKHLDVLSWNKYSPGYINTEIILLLLGLNVPLQKILKKVDQFMLKDVYNLKYSNECLVNYFKTHLDYSPANDQSLFDLLCFICNNEDKAISDLLSQQMYFAQLLAKVKRQLSLKLKGNMHIKIQKSVRLMGILDSFGVLQQNQVYCSFIKRSGQAKYNINQQKTFLTRNPCLHPGDIKLVRCVSDEEIESRFKQMQAGAQMVSIFKRYVNVIVFPQKGNYPLTTLISGGDLDGDYYFLCWDGDLIPYQSQITRKYAEHRFDDGEIQKQKALKIKAQQNKLKDLREEKQINLSLEKSNYIEFNQLSAQNNQHSQNTTLQVNLQLNQNQLQQSKPFSEDILDFYISFLEKSQLGLIATMHKIWAQYNKVTCNQCIRLSQIHSHQIDYAKKGKKIPLPFQLRPKRSMQIFSSRDFKVDLDHTDLGKIYGKITKQFYDNQFGKNATHQLDVVVPSPFINHWTVTTSKQNSYSYTQIQINQILDIILAYKNDIENCLIKNQKISSCQFYIYHGKDEDVITDQILIRQKYLSIFFCEQPESLDIYQSLTLQQHISKQFLQFPDQIYRKAFLWYLASNCLSLSKNNSIGFIRKDLLSIIKRSEACISKSGEQFVNKLTSGQLTNYQPVKLDEHQKPKGFPNVYGLSWNVIPKIILRLISKAKCEVKNQ